MSARLTVLHAGSTYVVGGLLGGLALGLAGDVLFIVTANAIVLTLFIAWRVS